MSKRDSNIIEIKLERVGKRKFNSGFNTNLKSIPGHPASVSPLWPIGNETMTEEYQIISSFGKMYVGESFTASLRVANVSPTTVLEHVVITCQLKYSNVKSVPLLFQTEIPSIRPEQVKRFAFTLNVETPDVYYLSFQISFGLPEIPEPITMGKLFKFEAKMPLECNNMIYRSQEGFYIQCRLTNCTIYPISLDFVNFMPSSMFTSNSLNSQEKYTVFNPGEVRSYLYLVSEKMPLGMQVELGNLAVSWHNTTGDAGQIASQTLSHSFKIYKIVSLKIIEKPDYFVLEKPVPVKVKLTNLSYNFYMEDLRLEVDETQMKNVVLTPLSSLYLGKLPPQDSKIVDFALMAKVPGIHKIEGIKISSGQKYWDFDTCQICCKNE